ncbi:uncharacterized protein LOC114146564 [Xiphophorus couchianus]|uniref:uncharacterized protein LOC114146564 n=1 Tax=Xiphophorus couchianus TaxID=32473 RepID=UPI0010164F34|nr:uncharacterized protein LOC114146564 [Xiphophorus couchianus]
MAAVVLLFLISLLDSAEGSERRIVKSGSNLLLEVNKNGVGKDDYFFWKFNNSVNLVRFIPGGEPKIKYIERTDFFKDNYSLLLRNVQPNDTGNYEAQANGDTAKTVAEYTVIVQDPVSPVKLTVKPIKSSCYNFTVTCKTVDSQISGTFQCDNISCHLLDQTDLKDSSLKVHVEESSIICNHSNQVSWEKDVKNIISICEKPPVLNTATIVGITFGALLLVSIMCSVLIIMCKRKRSANTVYEVPQETPLPNPYANPAEITESPSPTSTYALVQLHSRPVQSNVTSTSTNPQPETIYAQVDRAAKFNSKPAAVNR